MTRQSMIDECVMDVWLRGKWPPLEHVSTCSGCLGEFIELVLRDWRSTHARREG
jgi:hypothetical protein